MTEVLLEQLSNQYTLLSERYIELEAAYVEARAAASLMSGKTRSNTSSISTMSAATLITPCQSAGSSFLKTPRQARNLSRLSSADITSYHVDIRKTRQELLSESQKRRVAECEVHRLRLLLNKAKSTLDSHASKAKFIATPRDLTSRDSHECLSARLPFSGVSFTSIFDNQIDSLKSCITQLGLSHTDRSELFLRIDKIAEVASLTRREFKDVKSPPITARRQKSAIPN